ncbi:MAG: hypothetical protein ABSB81_11770 [Halobacteriota archaeon]|jgi:hypothetical protein
MDAIAHATSAACGGWQLHSTFERGANSTAVCIFGKTRDTAFGPQLGGDGFNAQLKKTAEYAPHPKTKP